MKTIIKTILLLVVLAFAALAVWHFVAPKDEDRGLRPAKIEDVRRMVELATIEIREETPVKGHIGKRHIVAMQCIEGRIGYDLDKIKIEDSGDTIFVTLPEETITLRESTEPGSYEVIDEWNDNPLRSGKWTAAETNELKARHRRVIERSLRRRGYTERARRSAGENVTALLHMLTGRPVVVN